MIEGAPFVAPHRLKSSYLGPTVYLYNNSRALAHVVETVDRLHPGLVWFQCGIVFIEQWVREGCCSDGLEVALDGSAQALRDWFESHATDDDASIYKGKFAAAEPSDVDMLLGASVFPFEDYSDVPETLQSIIEINDHDLLTIWSKDLEVCKQVEQVLISMSIFKVTQRLW